MFTIFWTRFTNHTGGKKWLHKKTRKLKSWKLKEIQWYLYKAIFELNIKLSLNLYHQLLLRFFFQILLIDEIWNFLVSLPKNFEQKILFKSSNRWKCKTSDTFKIFVCFFKFYIRCITGDRPNQLFDGKIRMHFKIHNFKMFKVLSGFWILKLQLSR